ncbi:MAG: DUF1993 domain-containing protein [Bdellovibrionaceae bacterium]|nr:DUF1993 domain-containing protein [Pseudobdellovibrionaceae bacterium]
MQPTVNELVVEQFSRSLGNLKNILKKAQTHAQERKFDENLFLQSKLAADMFPLIKQVQISCDIVKASCARLTGTTPPAFADDEKTMVELFSRIDKTLDYVKTFATNDFKGYETQKVSFFWNPGKHITGHEYVISYAIPNFYFHVSAAYAILRSNGVHLGKGDYLGEMQWKAN